MLWAGDQRRKILANVEHYDGDVVLVSATAPGVDGVTYFFRQPNGRYVDVPDWRAHCIPWSDREARRACPRAGTRWNRTAPTRWRALHRAARQLVKQREGAAPTLLARTWEYQKRGLLHVHVVVGAGSARELHLAHCYADALEELRERYGFGFIDRGRKRSKHGRRSLQVIPAGTAARYVAKYLSPLDGEGKPTMSETVTRRDVPGHVVHVSRDLTMATGVTMRYLRHVRLCWVLKIDPRTGETLRSVGDRAMATGDVTELLATVGRLNDL